MLRARLAAMPLALVLVTAAGACSAADDDPVGGDQTSATPSQDTTPSSSSAPTPSETPTGSPSTADEPAGSVVEVRITGSRVSPNAEQVDLSTGDTLVFDIVSDRPGELHVHSKPEQYVEFGDGRTRAEISIETPGSVEVEEHDTSAVVAILEVR